MEIRISTIRAIGKIALIVPIVSLVIYFQLIPEELVPSDVSTVPTSYGNLPENVMRQLSIGLPVRISIPKIDVDATIEYVGLTEGGAMDTPDHPSTVAWFELGQRPGEVGTAVMAGHYGFWKNKEGSVFDHLYKLRGGDRIYVEDDQGSIIAFNVESIRRYDPREYPTDVFVSTDGGSHLNLITCEGTWDEVEQTYSKRLVIFANRIW